MHRRAFLGVLGLLVAPVAAGAQPAPGKVYRIGLLGTHKPSALTEALRAGLRDLGYVEGKNIVIEPDGRKGSSIGFQRWRPNS